MWPIISVRNVVSTSSFPLRDGQKLDLEKAYLLLKEEFNCKEVMLNERFFLLCIKFDGGIVDVSSRGNLKFCSTLEASVLRRVCNDLWNQVFRKCVV